MVVDDLGRVLLGRRAKDPSRGKWVLPGGKVRPFETIADAARRELYEEAGLEISVDGIATIREIVRPPEEHRLIIYSHGRVVGGSLRAGSDLSEPRFFSSTDLAELDLSEVVRDVLVEIGWLHRLAA